MRSTAHRHSAIALVALLFLSSCGMRMSHDEILDANKIVVQGGPTSGTPIAIEDEATLLAGEDAGAATSSGSTANGSTGKVGSSGKSAGTAGKTQAGLLVATDKTPLVIGAVGTYSGPGAVLAEATKTAIQVWVKNINEAGGLAGREVKYITIDDGGDPSRHVAALRDLVESKKIVAFVGNAAPFTATAGEKYINTARVPVVGTMCASLVEERSPVQFTQCGKFRNLIVNAARNAVRFAGGRKLAVISCVEAEPCRNADNDLNNGGAAEAGIEIVYRAQASIGQPDFTSECLNARDAGADVIFPATDPNSTVRIAASCARQGYRPQFINVHNTNPADRSNPGLENMLISVPTFPFVGSSLPAAREFNEAFEAAGKGEPSPQASLGWVAAKFFEHVALLALKETGAITSPAIINAVLSLKGETLGGLSVPLTFDPKGGPLHPPCAWAVRATQSSWKPLQEGKLLCP